MTDICSGAEKVDDYLQVGTQVNTALWHIIVNVVLFRIVKKVQDVFSVSIS